MRQSLRIATLLFVVFGVCAACGRTEESVSAPAIREGETVSDEATGPERVSTVGLVISTSQGTGTCSAALLTRDVLVTAAHCVPRGAQIRAFFGVDMRGSGAAEQTIRVTSATVHPDYDRDAESNDLRPRDIAVLKLAQPAPRRFVPATVLGADVALDPSESALIAGYGITEDGNGGGRLRSVRTTYARRDDLGRYLIHDARLRGACSGDSGGPMWVRRDAQWKLAGVLSGGPIPCRGVNVYTSIGAHWEFVEGALSRL